MTGFIARGRGRAGLAAVAGLALTLVTSAAHATLWKWTDDRGSVHMTDDSSTIPAPFREQAVELHSDASPAPPPRALGPSRGAPATSPAPDPRAHSAAPSRQTDRAVDVHPKEILYDVSGATAQELRQSLDRNGPSAPDGRRYDGFTRWSIAWRYRLEQEPTACAIRDIGVPVDVTVTLPRWKERNRAPASLIERWDRYLSALRKHEAGHRELAERFAHEVAGYLSGLATVNTCQQLQEQIERTRRYLEEKYRLQEVEYDSTTDHGHSQGARL